jgi:uncharacterized membrane protein
MTLSIAQVFRPTVLLALALMAVIVMMILPVPAWLLDIGLAASFALAILIFTVTLFIERPLDFSIFPDRAAGLADAAAVAQRLVDQADHRRGAHRHRHAAGA